MLRFVKLIHILLFQMLYLFVNENLDADQCWYSRINDTAINALFLQPGLKQKLEQMQLKLEWVERMDITSNKSEKTEEETKDQSVVHDDFKREMRLWVYYSRKLLFITHNFSHAQGPCSKCLLAIYSSKQCPTFIDWQTWQNMWYYQLFVNSNTADRIVWGRYIRHGALIAQTFLRENFRLLQQHQLKHPTAVLSCSQHHIALMR